MKKMLIIMLILILIFTGCVRKDTDEIINTGTLKPIEGTSQPVTSTEKPIEGTSQPVTSTEKPMEKTSSELISEDGTGTIIFKMGINNLISVLNEYNIEYEQVDVDEIRTDGMYFYFEEDKLVYMESGVFITSRGLKNGDTVETMKKLYGDEYEFYEPEEPFPASYEYNIGGNILCFSVRGNGENTDTVFRYEFEVNR